jgi:hypothetical protein
MNAIHALSQLSYSPPNGEKIITTTFCPVNMILTGWKNYTYNSTLYRAGVVKLVDALDSKSSGPQVRVGSIPTSGTINNIKELALTG